jgi:hypothetical protein
MSVMHLHPTTLDLPYNLLSTVRPLAARPGRGRQQLPGDALGISLEGPRGGVEQTGKVQVVIPGFPIEIRSHVIHPVFILVTKKHRTLQ